MTVPSTVQRVDALGNGVTTTFSFAPFTITQASDLSVILRSSAGVETVLSHGTLNTNYSLNVTTFPGTGSITYPASGSTGGTVLPTGATLVLRREVPLVQNSVYRNQTAFYGTSVEQSLDYLMMAIQELNEQLQHTIQSARTDPATPLTLPTTAARANQLLGFDASGNPVPSQPTATLVSSPMQPVVGAASVQMALGLLGGAASFANIAALQANTSALSGFVFVRGYYSTNDGGEGWFMSGASTTANGGTIINDAHSVSWYRVNAGKGGYSVKWFGAKGDGATDDASAIQACINYCQTNSLSPVTIPTGTYKISTGLTVTGRGLRIVGDSQYNTLIQPTVTNISMLTFTGVAGGGISKVFIDNKFFSGIAVATVTLNTCVECHIDECIFTGGYYALQFLAGADSIVTRTKIYNAYGPAQFYLGNGSAGYFWRMKIDQPWPSGVAPTAANMLGGWTASTAVTGTKTMTIGGYLCQCIGGGTTKSGAAPSLPTQIDTPFTDGTVTWQVACLINNAAVILDSNVVDGYFTDCDMTGAYYDCVRTANSSATVGPQLTMLDRCIFAEFVNNGIYAHDGAGLNVGNCIFSGGISAASIGVNLNSNWIGDANIHNNLFFSMAYGVYLEKGVSDKISDNSIYGCSVVGIGVGPGTTTPDRFTITDNNVGTSATWGTNARSMQIAVGLRTYGYMVTGNNGLGATAGWTDAGTATVAKYTTGNIG